jgi:SAM-dependent methyltransferase
MQKGYYRENATDLAHAKKIVHPDYDLARSQSRSYLAYVLNDYLGRTATLDGSACIPDALARLSALKDIRVLDFGCGVGRLMEELASDAIHVDGADISQEMVGFARQNPALQSSRFFVTSGYDCGDAPENHYDLVISTLCLQHVCVRQTRLSILEAIHKVLNHNGVVHIQFHYYPTLRADQVPGNHACWTAERTDASSTNSDADVWITPDELQILLDDFGRYFKDVNLRFVDFPDDAPLFTEAYDYPFSHVLVSGSKRISYASRIYLPQGEHR